LIPFRQWVAAFILGAVLAPSDGCTTEKEDVFLFSYFTGNGEDGLHLATSPDGLQWTSLNGGKAVLSPEAGKDRLMRDPCIIRGGDGLFHMVWTVSWNEQGIGYASSKDLIQWSEQQYIPVMEHEPGSRNCWAPEIFYDAPGDRYLVFWSTTIPGRFSATDSTGDNGYNHRIYYTLTGDFKSFGPVGVLYDHGFNVIDGTLCRKGDSFILFLKDETRWPEPEKNIRMATSRELTGPYSEPSVPITRDWVEGPTVARKDGGWILYFDRYREHEMGARYSVDMNEWTDISDKIRFPEGTRHGSVLRISQKELEPLLEAFPVK